MAHTEVDLESQVQGVLPPANGGMGTGSVTGVLRGNGTSPVSPATAGTDYLVPGGALGQPSSGDLTHCTFPALNQNTTGNAGTATKLQTARNINSVPFDGTADITLPTVVQFVSTLPATGVTGVLYVVT